MLDAVLYVDKTGCQWRQFPREYPPWKTVYSTFRRWRLNGTWNRVHSVLREAVRRRAGKRVQPSVAMGDSESAKTVQKGEAAVTTPARR
jgi:putative transposase